jgi:hypothetical protein
MRIIGALLLASTFIMPSAQAREQLGSLPAGKPAGIHKAQSETSTIVLVAVGAGLTGLAIAALASGGKAGGCVSLNPNTPCVPDTPPTATTTTTSTTTSTP